MWCEDVLNTNHCFIGGASGSGKSQAVKNVLYYAYCKRNAQQMRIILIDNKQTTFKPFAKLPQTLYYACTLEEIDHALQRAVNLMYSRYEDIKADVFAEVYNGSDCYIFIDELADLMQLSNNKAVKEIQKRIIENLTKISQLGRASKVHIIACSQCATKDLLKGLKANFSAFIALPCATAQDSRNIVRITGAENLQIGSFLFLLDNKVRTVKFDVIPVEPLQRLLIAYHVKF